MSSYAVASSGESRTKVGYGARLISERRPPQAQIDVDRLRGVARQRGVRPWGVPGTTTPWDGSPARRVGVNWIVWSDPERLEGLLAGQRWIWIGAGVALVAIGLVLTVQFITSGDADADPDLAELDPDAVALGAGVYASNCAVCHGVSGEGQPNWQQRLPNGVLPPPPHDASGHTWHHADGLLYRIVRDGGEQFASPTSPSGMPAFGEALTDEEIRAVIVFLKSLWGDEDRTFQSQVSASDPFP